MSDNFEIIMKIDHSFIAKNAGAKALLKNNLYFI